MTQQEPNGVLIVNKHAGVTSHDIVNRIRRLYQTKRVGHTGTLDPMATGVLVVLLGRAAKASEYLSAERKRYRARLRLGLTTDTEDTTGTILSQTDAIPTNDELQAILPSFLGDVMQIPPMYSALKVGGKKLVDLARKGEIIDREARKITVFEISATPTDEKTDFVLEVSCSGGTYIRTLCADIGAKLGCGGAMAELCRLETGGFSLLQAHTIEELEALTDEGRRSLLIPTEELFSTLPKIRLPSFYERLCRSGCEIYLQKIKAELPVGTRVRLCSQDGEFFALGDVSAYPNGNAVKAIKMFVL